MSGEIRVAQLLSSIICDRIADQCIQLSESIDFGEENLDVRGELRELNEQIQQLDEIIQVQQKLANGASVSTKNIKDLQKKYEKRIKQLEEELIRKEGLSLTVTALDASKKPKLFGKGKFEEFLGDLILEQGKKLPASSGGYITLANLYTKLKSQVPDVEFSIKDLEKSCKNLKDDGLIEDISKRSGVKIIEFTPVSLTNDASKIFNLAVNKGYVTIEEIMIKTKWDHQRVTRVLESLINQKIARKVSSLDTGDQYYFPGIYGDDNW